MRILEELWYGRLCPAAQAGNGDEEYWELVGLLERNEDKLSQTLDEKQREDLQKMKDLWEEMERIGECAAFVLGFRLAVQIMAASV